MIRDLMLFFGGAAFGCVMACAVVARWPRILFLERSHD